MKHLLRFNENMSLAKSIISKKMDGFEKLKTLLSKNIGYIGKFTDYLMNENIPLSDLEDLYKDLIYLKSKQRNIDISSLKYEKVLDKIQEVKNEIDVNSLIQEFPAEQKELARQLVDNNWNTLLQASRKEQKSSLISKISRYKTKEELLNALKLFSKTAFNNREEIKQFLKTSKSKLVFENENTMVVQVNNLEDNQKLGSDTSWCILGKSMWDSYTRNRYQFIIYDFRRDEWDPLFKIGFTLNKDLSIKAAHDILDKSCSSKLMELVNEQGIKFSELVPKAEVIDVTSDMISRVNTRTTLTTLQSYAENVSKELAAPLLNKILSVSTTISENKNIIISNLVGKIFSDAEYVTNKDLEKINARLEKINIKSLRGKRVRELPSFDSNTLNPSIAVKMLDYWKEDNLLNSFSTTSLTQDILRVPGNWLYSGDELQYKGDWDKEKVTKISDKINELWNSGKWKNKSEYNKSSFNANYVIFNYLLGRKDKVKPEALSYISESHKVEFAYILKLPIDISKSDYLRSLNKWAIPLVVKKDCPESNVYLEKPLIVELVDRFIDNQLNLKLNKQKREEITRRIYSLKDTPGKKKLIDTLNKFKRTDRVGTKVQSDDGKLTIQLF